jgi:hypothetical protein
MVLNIDALRAMNARLLALDVRLMSCEAHMMQNLLLIKGQMFWYRDHLKNLEAIVKSMDRIGRPHARERYPTRRAPHQQPVLLSMAAE